MDCARGQLLIAGPTLLDPRFWRAVVLVVEHGVQGAFGVVLNRPSETLADEAVPALRELGVAVDLGDRLYVGGPVQPSEAIVLAEFEDATDAALLAFDDIGVLGASPYARDRLPGVRRGRVFVGHAGWGPGQLDAELQRSDWILETASSEDAFTADPLDLWSAVLTRKGGGYALLARMPPDPSVN